MASGFQVHLLLKKLQVFGWYLLFVSFCEVVHPLLRKGKKQMLLREWKPHETHFDSYAIFLLWQRLQKQPPKCEIWKNSIQHWKMVKISAWFWFHSLVRKRASKFTTTSPSKSWLWFLWRNICYLVNKNRQQMWPKKCYLVTAVETHLPSMGV